MPYCSIPFCELLRLPHNVADFHIAFHIAFLYVNKNLKLLDKKGTYTKGFTAHPELNPSQHILSVYLVH